MYKFKMFCFFIFIVQISAISCRQLLKIDGDLNVAFVLKNCNSTPFLTQTLTQSAVWTVRRLNFLEFDSHPISMGLSAYEVCEERDVYSLLFNLFQSNEQNFTLGVVSNELGVKVKNFATALNLKTRVVVKILRPVISAAVSVMKGLNFLENVTLWTPSEYIAEDFFDLATPYSVCVTKYIIYNKKNIPTVDGSGPLVIFGDHSDINYILANSQFTDNANLLIVPLDGSLITKIPQNSYILQAPQSLEMDGGNILPTPLFFEVANPIINLAQAVLTTLKAFCNESIYKINCLRSDFRDKREFYSDPEILSYLKIEPLKINFVYNVFRMENTTYNKVFSYNIFDGNLVFLEEAANYSQPAALTEQCKNYAKFGRAFKTKTCSLVKLRQESWVFAYLSISILGVLFCIAIFVFISIRILNKDVLEGNPILTLILLVAVMFIFCAVIPFCLESEYKNFLCVAQTLAVSLTFSGAFSLVLARCILLASASHDVDFMSHISGPVQFFLTFFIFAVQAALDLQVGNCLEIYFFGKLITLLSYNIILIILLLCLTPLVCKCKRNYTEGKYFAIAMYVNALIWCTWVPLYIWLEDNWKDPIICFGLVSTAGVFVGAIFIPRTYLMIISSARGANNTTMPSLASTTSVLDIYRASSQPQPVYDCVNVAVINAGNGATAEEDQNPPYLYSRPNITEDDVGPQWAPTVDNFKITRF